MKKLLLLSLFLSLTLIGRAWAQNRVISGRVLDVTTNEGLPGVSVLVKGSSVGTATNAEGTYTLSVPADATTLVFKQLGYGSLERAITNSNTIDVSLSVSTEELSEVVVTALGISREKRALGYAVADIDAQQLVQKSEPDVVRTLSGKVAGVVVSNSSSTPGGSTRIIIRGNTSMSKANGPLFVVDGIPYDNKQTDSDSPLVEGTNYSNRAADIDPNNIASMTILKGAAAGALYGSRAAGGVVVITTKTGSMQRGVKGIQINYNSGYSLETIAGLPEYQNSYGTGANFVGPFLTNGSWGPRFGSPEAPATLPHPQAGNPNFPNIPAGTTIPYQAAPNNVKDFFNTGSLFDNSISLTGNSDNAKFTAVVSRYDQKGIIPNSSFLRHNISAGGSGTYNKFVIGGNVAYTNSYQRGPLVGGSSAQGGASALSRIMFLPRNLDLQNLPNTDPVTNGSVFGWLSTQADNPYWSTNNNSFTSRVDRVAGNITASYAIKDWLTLSYTGGVNTYTDARRSTIRPGNTGKYATGRTVEDMIQNTELEQTVLLTFDKNLTEDLSLKAIVGNNINQRVFESTSFLGTGSVVFGIDNLSNATEIQPYGSTIQKRRLVGVLADVTLGYKDWAYLNATARRDNSSTLNKGGDVNKPGRGFFYPSVSGSVIFTEALGLDYSWLSSGKIRAGYARVGNDAGPYESGLVTYFSNPKYGNNVGTTDFPFNGVPAQALNFAINNPALTPEFTNEFEVGTDFDFFKNRINISASYYDRRTTNQIGDVTLPTASGFYQLRTNFGEISNKGVELAATVVPVDLRGFRWSSTFNFTHNKNIVEKLTEGVDQIVINAAFGSGLVQPILMPGQPFGVLYGSNADRDEQGNLLVDPSTGRLIPALNPKVIGNPNPQFLMGFINQFTFKGLTLNTLIDYRKGGNIYSTTLQSELGRGVTKDTEDRDQLYVIKGVKGDPITHQPIRDANGNTIPNNTAISLNDYYFGTGSAGIGGTAEQSIYDATTVRLREVTLGYDLPKTLLAKTPFSMINVSLSGRNLYWYSPNIPKYTNYDPEVNTFNSASNAQGIEFTNSPSTRRYGVNLRVTF
ncbi:SusC/RagA family TonB-linked outer membrane protein [Hymenobacter aquaticus]|uniref:SusC/RagA family TonB-linked outer membrane protein n=1 Tax=Hymenobacter aquaticus TaxID=1867101 RepID=A0A4Z0Q0K4_9BACT|nr:SusC/RagA family TonB-linked outer membrane protein [Hymenobacter aquaticus]TGE22282.1 SusC/RagA family TonB-linked outer membrane protein [Hymenobacter aquaticus]